MYSLFNDAFSSSHCIMSNERLIMWVMNWKGRGKKQSWRIWRYYRGICLEGLEKTMKNLGQDSWSLGWNFEVGSPGVLITGPQCLVIKEWIEGVLYYWSFDGSALLCWTDVTGQVCFITKIVALRQQWAAWRWQATENQNDCWYAEEQIQCYNSHLRTSTDENAVLWKGYLSF
jgi:hypothetical protein